MNRRTFVGLSAVALAALPLRADEPRIKVGLLGATHSHAPAKLNILQNHAAFEFIGAAETSDRVRRAHPAVRWIDRDELIETAELVVVESDVRDHARDALDALQAGKHVHVEKPPSAQWQEMLKLAAAARAQNRLLQVGYMWRHNPGFIRVFEAVRNGWLGEVYQVRAMMNNHLSANLREDWAQFAGGAFFELAAHLVDAVIRLLGRPNSVTPVLRSSKGDALADNNVVVFEFERVLATITNSTNQPNAFAHRQFEVFGTKGTMLIKPLEQPVLAVDLAQAAGPYQKGPQEVTLPKYERYRGEFDELARCIQTRTPLPVSMDQELLIHEWLLRASGMFTE